MHAPQLLSPCAVTTEALAPKAATMRSLHTTIKNKNKTSLEYSPPIPMWNDALTKAMNPQTLS